MRASNQILIFRGNSNNSKQKRNNHHSVIGVLNVLKFFHDGSAG